MFDEAVSVYNQAIELNSNHAQSYSNKGISINNVYRYCPSKFKKN